MIVAIIKPTAVFFHSEIKESFDMQITESMFNGPDEMFQDPQVSEVKLEGFRSQERCSHAEQRAGVLSLLPGSGSSKGKRSSKPHPVKKASY